MIHLKRTCYACPEQYSAFHMGEQVGYLRLRHGCFTVSVPDHRGDDIYDANPKGDGIFEDDERHTYLRIAVDAIERWLGPRAITAKWPPLSPDSDVRFTVDDNT